MRVLVRPCYPDYLRDKMFAREHIRSVSHNEPYVHLREAGLARGIEMFTWDMHPLETAEVIFFQDLPARRKEVVDARRAAPRAKFILQLLESPLSRPHYFLKENHDLFDAILTYCPQLCDERRYFRYFLPIGYPPDHPPDPPFAQRRPLVMVNSNRWLGIWAFRQPGLTGLPLFGPLFSDWKISLGQTLRQNHGELYSRRRHLARTADRLHFDGLDVFGGGWRGEPASWAHRFFRHKPFQCARGAFVGDKLELLPTYRFALAFENLKGNVGYVSEKPFDPLYTGVVPIYLGDQNITDVIPEDCFVDARKFRDDAELLEFARDCPEDQWRRYRLAGERFCHSEGILRFQPPAFAQTVLNVIERVSGG
jgi:hypothetical protein